MKLIVRVDKNWGIGKAGQLISLLPEDMKFFRSTTKGNVVVMGRKTLESFPGGEPLKNRVNIVLTGNRSYEKDGCLICHSVKEVLKAVEAYQTDEVYVIGGQIVYEEFLPYCDTAYVTYMQNAYEADTWFVNLDEKEEWKLSEVGEDREYEGGHYEFRTYKKKENGGNCL